MGVMANSIRLGVAGLAPHPSIIGMTYPKPDRSNVVPNLAKTPDNEDLDIGWCEGVLTDGRPYRMECWAADQITNVTVFMSTIGLENCTNAQFVDLLERERVVSWRAGARKSAGAAQIADAAGNPMWSINIVIGVDGEPAVADSVPIFPYAL